MLQVHDDELTNTRESFQLDMHASNICTAVESLLLLVSELKRHTLLSSASNVRRELDISIGNEPLLEDSAADKEDAQKDDDTAADAMQADAE